MLCDERDGDRNCAQGPPTHLYSVSIQSQLSPVVVKRPLLQKQAVKSALQAAVHEDGAVEAGDRKSTRLNSSHSGESRMPSSA